MILHPPYPGLPFRLMAIVDGRERLLRALDLARNVPEIPFGLMLRDPEHRADRTAILADELRRAGIPGNLQTISNACDIDGMGYIHLTSAQVASGAWRPDRPFGASAHDVAEALAAEELGARYITASPVFPTSSKPGHPGSTISLLESIVRAVTIPVFALGGVTLDSMEACLEAGAYGIAGISLFDTVTPEEARRIFLARASPAPIHQP